MSNHVTPAPGSIPGPGAGTGTGSGSGSEVRAIDAVVLSPAPIVDVPAAVALDAERTASAVIRAAAGHHGHGRRALVTGASGDLGRAIARRLAHDGAHVILHANARRAAVDALAAELKADGCAAQPVAFDITDRAATAAALAALLADGPIQIVVNNAGIHDDAVFPGMRGEQWDRVIDVSLNGFFNVTQPLMLPMIRTRWGRIISISSVAGVTGNRGQVNYAAAKGALHSASKALSMEVASRGITVNAVAPGIIGSAMADAAFDDKLIAQLVPAKRAGRADEVAALVGFLASDEAGYISGQVISINGGMA